MDEINSFLKGFLKGKNQKEKYYTAYLQVHWREIAGDYICEKSMPKMIKETILFLDVVSSSWAHNFLTIKNDIIKKINSNFNVIIVKDIKFNVKVKLEAIENKNEEDEKIVLPELEEKDRQDIKKMVVNINDQLLSKKLIKVIEKDKQRKIYLIQKGNPLCKMCLVPLSDKGEICATCEKEKKEKIKKELVSMFYNIPWLSYSQARDLLDVEEGLFFSIKDECTRTFFSNAVKENATGSEIKRYVMIKTGCSAFDMTDELIEKTMKNIRGNKRVFAYWS